MFDAPETFALIDRLRRSGSRAAMATLVRTIGTTPRKEGTKMFVGEGGSIFGSVTIGGCVDARVIEQSHDVLATSSSRVLHMPLGDEEAWEIGLTCGGAVDVFVEPVTGETAAIYQRARERWQEGHDVAIATVIRGENAGARTLLDAEALRERFPGVTESKTVAAGADEIYVEVLRPAPTLLIFGAGAVAIPLVSLAKTVGLATIVIDSRPRFASPERFPDAGQIRVGIVSEIAGEMNFGPMTPVVLLAHDTKIDLPVLERALGSEAPYIGMLGSRRRGAAMLEILRERGASDEQLARIRVPIGLDLGGGTAAEIALSIVSEIVAVLHGRNGASLSRR